MTPSLIDPRDPLERQNEKLLKITQALMSRVEQSTDASGAAYAQFQRAAQLEEEVRARTRDLERALDLLNDSNAQLAQANRETEAARSNLANAIETVQEGFALFSADEELVMCNSRFGIHMPDIRDQLVPGLPFMHYVDLASRSQFLSLPESETPELWAKRRIERHSDDHVIFNVRMIWNRWVQISEHRTPDGGTVILQTDVTDIMRLERQERDRILDDQARLIRATLEHLDQGLCIFDSQSRLVGWNQRASELLSIPANRFHMGVTFATLFGQIQDDILFDDAMSPQQIESWVTGQTNRTPLSFEIRQGRTKTLSVFAQEMPDTGFVISFTDVTAERQAVQAIYEANETLEQRVTDRTEELAEALQDAKRANASKSRFVAAASHDLLQPLSAAKLYVAALDTGQSDDTSRMVLAKATNALHSVENILEALLDISKLDSGHAAVHVSSVPLGVMLGQLEDELAPSAVQKGLDLQIMPTNAFIKSDATYLRRILQNLISNAIRYTEEGRVMVSVQPGDDRLQVTVRDTGIGIPQDKQELIFREFHRLNADVSASEGMGLGLAIVERACSLLHHPLTLESELGKGTVFTLTLPLAETGSGALEHEDPQQVDRRNDLTNIIALLIENDANLRHAMTLILEKWGVDVLDCGSEQDAHDLLTEIGVSPDIIIADYQLDDDKLGTDAVRNLITDFGNMPACIITADRSVELIETCAGAGITLLHKPINPENLLAFLKEKLGAKGNARG